MNTLDRNHIQNFLWKLILLNGNLSFFSLMTKLENVLFLTMLLVRSIDHTLQMTNFHRNICLITFSGVSPTNSNFFNPQG